MNLSAQPFDVSKVSVNALKVVARLVEHGYQAYLVGGCVRDILLGKSPKDFDVATDAHPDEVRELFRNSRIVGRRFCIVHARFGRELVEITTFRGPHEDKYEANHTESGMTVSDNIYGTFKEDVFRRDFTVNAIYYQPQSDELVDMAEGNADIAARTLRTLGAPEARFREDPVRMLRAIRFKAKLGFDIDTEAEASVRSQGQLIQDVPPARLFEEVLKLFMAGFAERAFNCLMEYGLYGWLFPDSKRALDDEPMAAELVRLALASTDRRIAEGLPVTPAFIYAAILWFPFLAERQRLSKTGMAPMEASLEAANGIIGKQQLFTSIPRRFSGPVRDIWFLQFRLPFRTGKKPEQVMGHKRFRAAYDFLLLREESGELGKSSVGSWWTEYQEATEEDRAAMKREAVQQQHGKRDKGRKKSSRSGQTGNSRNRSDSANYNSVDYNNDSHNNSASHDSDYNKSAN